MSVVKTAKYISTEVDANKNRYWYGYLNDDNTVKVEWGRVGNTAQSKTHDFSSQSEAERFFEGKCREKEGPKKGYRKLNVIDNPSAGKQVAASAGSRDLTSLATKQIDAGCKVTKSLVSNLVSWNVHQITSQTTISYNAKDGLFSTPLGIVTQNAIDDARDLLIKMKPFVKEKDFANRKYSTLLNDYLMLIPQDVGRKLDAARLYPNVSSLSNQSDILDSLEASLDACSSQPAASAKKSGDPKIFDVKLSMIDDGSEIDRVKKKFVDTASSVHECSHLKVKSVYNIHIGAMKNAFEQGKQKGNVQELWHGTRKSNLLSILSKGFIIPKSYVNGWAFGAGVYFANRSTKSLQYAYGTWDGRSRDNNCFMFLVDVALGKPHIPPRSQHDLHEYGHDSVYAKVGKTSYLQNDELIIFNTAQCNPTRLIEFTETGR